MADPTVAILGRPNVGKSTLFNRLTGERRAIVEETAGVTRDRLYGNVQWQAKNFHLVDTGGFVSASGDLIETTVRHQAELASYEADLILFMVDGKSGIIGDDQVLAEKLRQLDKPVILVVNKIDDLVHEARSLEFYELGFGEPYPIGASSGRAVGDLLDAILDRLPWATMKESVDKKTIDLAIIGVPNVGKSSFLNAIVKQDKSIVTDIPGTTRDSVDSYLKYMDHTLRLIDTAGLRRQAKVSDNIEFYSTVRTHRAIDECQVAVVMLDATRGFHDQDKHVITEVIDRGKGLVVAVNKWDAIKKDDGTMGEWVTRLRAELKVLEHTPLVFVSVNHNQRLRKVLQVAIDVHKERSRKLSTTELNRFLADATGYLPPPAVQGKRIAINYVTQVHRAPPVFAFFTNHPDLIPETYRRYIENRLREKFGFTGVALRVSFRQK